MSELRDAILGIAKENNWDPVDIATIMSYETAGTFDPWKKGPRTQWGRHRGLIQWGEPQARKYGVSKATSITDQVKAAARFMKDHGVKPGDGILPMYASINAGGAHRIHASDANNGGAPGTVMDKVRDQMDGHRRKAQSMFTGYTGGGHKPVTASPLAAPEAPEAPAQTMEQPEQPTTYSTSGEQPDGTVPNHSLSPAYVEAPVANAAPVQHPDAPASDRSLWQLQKDAYNVEQTLPWLMSDAGTGQADPNFVLDSQRVMADLKELKLDVEQYAPRLGAATSEANYKELLGSVSDDADRIRRLSEAGFKGGVLRVANSILDPVALGAEIGASLLIPGSGVVAKAGRTSRVAHAAFAGGAAGLAAESVGVAVNPHREQIDLLYGTVFGAGIGGVVGALRKNPSTMAEATRLQKAANDFVQDYEYDTMQQAGSAGAARVNRPDNFLDDESLEFLDHGDIAETFGRRGRFDLSAMLDKSKNPVVRMLGGLVQDGTGKKGGAINAIAPSEERMLFREEFMSAAHRTYNPALKEYFEEMKVGVLDRPKAERDFNEKVDAYIRDRTVGREEKVSKSVARMGNKIAQLQEELLRMAQNPRLREGGAARPVKGFDAVSADKHYMTRYMNPTRVQLASREYVPGTMDDLIFGAIRSANPDIADDLARKIAKGYAKGITRRAHGLDEIAMRNLGEESVDDLIKELELGTNDAANLKAWFESRSKSDKGRDARAKRRVLLDENYRLKTAQRVDGTVDEQGFGLDDLIQKDAMGTFSRYADSMSGMIALARYRFKDPATGEMLVDGITSDGEFAKLIQATRKRGADLIREGKMTQKDIDQDVKRLEFAYSNIRGRPISDAENTDFGWWARAVRKFNFSRIMNVVGFAQLAEIGVTMGHLGVKASFSHVPALRRIMTQDGETILKSGLADDLESWVAAGTDRLRATSDYRYDDMTSLREEATGTWRDKAEHVLNVGNRVTSEVSGMMQVNTMLQRWTAASIVQRFANIAQKGGKGMSDERWADLGVDPQMKDRILKMINTDGNLEFTKGLISGRRVSRLHADRWADKEAAEAFRAATYRLSNQLIQKNDIGNLMMWMSGPAAKMLMQFRTFMIGAYGKQTMKALKFRDREAVMAAVMSMAFGGAAYVAQSKIKAIGRSDREEWEEKRLGWDKIGTAAFARTGASSIIPMLIDTGAYVSGNDALFSHTRTTGQASNMLFGNPTTGGVDDIAQAGRAIAGLGEDREWSGEEARAIQRIMPFGNSIPATMAIESLISGADLPAYKPR